MRPILQTVQPAFLSGFTLADWIRLLRSSDAAVHREFLPRAAAATLGAAITSLLSRVEPEVRLDADEEDCWQRPLFIIGLPRSGTTHLFHLLSQDPQFCFATRLDAYNPHTMLTLRRLGLANLLRGVPVKRRLQDNVHTAWLTPEEDDIALAILCGWGPKIRAIFPDRRRYGQFVEDGGSRLARDPQTFQRALGQFSRKLVRLHRRPVLLKSPSHLAAIPQILGLFPAARFVTILRQPCDQYASLAASLRNGRNTYAALHPPGIETDESLLQGVKVQLDRYLATRSRVPAGRLVEITYEDIVADEAGTLAKIYAGLDLAMPATLTHPRDREAYRRNSHPPVATRVREQLAEIYRPVVQAGLLPVWSPHAENPTLH